MRGLSVSVGIAIMLVIAACSSSSPSDTGDVSSSSPSSKSGNTVQSTTVDQDWSTYRATVRNPCTGGFVRFTGKKKVVVKVKDRGDGTFEVQSSLFVKADGTDASGATYQLISHREDESSTKVVSGCPSTFSETRRYRVTTSGGGNNYTIIERFEVTINCDGTVDVKFDEATTECQ